MSTTSIMEPRETVSIPLYDLRVGHIMQLAPGGRLLVMSLPDETDEHAVLKVLDLNDPGKGPEIAFIDWDEEYVDVLADRSGLAPNDSI